MEHAVTRYITLTWIYILILYRLYAIYICGRGITYIIPIRTLHQCDGIRGIYENAKKSIVLIIHYIYINIIYYNTVS